MSSQQLEFCFDAPAPGDLIVEIARCGGTLLKRTKEKSNAYAKAMYPRNRALGLTGRSPEARQKREERRLFLQEASHITGKSTFALQALAGRYCAPTLSMNCFLLWYQVYCAWRVEQVAKDRLKWRTERQKDYVYENRDRINSYKRERRKRPGMAEREKAFCYRWLKEHPAYLSTYNKMRRRTDVQFRLKGLLRSRINEAVKAQRVKKNSPTLILLGCTLSQFKEHLEKQFSEGMSWINHGSFWHVDHIIPCVKFDLTDIQQQRLCFHYSNLRPLPGRENLRKHAKITVEHQFPLLF